VLDQELLDLKDEISDVLVHVNDDNNAVTGGVFETYQKELKKENAFNEE
jgi:hypothetical protein